MDINLKDDIRLVQNARKNSCANENDYTVGVVVKTKSGRRYVGSNRKTEDSKVIWAEKVAIDKAVAEGEKEFEYIVVMCGKKNQNSEKYIPSDECKKYISDFVDENLKIFVIYENNIEKYMFSEV